MSGSKSCHCHLHLWATRKNNHSLPQLLCNLLIHTFLHCVFKTRCQSTCISTSSLNLTDSRFDALLLKVKAHLWSNSPRMNTFSANHQSSPPSPPSKGTPHIRPLSRPPTLGKQPSSTFPRYTSVAMQATPPQLWTFHLVTWYTPSDPPSAKPS